MNIPIFVLCYNNYKYVSLLILQLTTLLINPNITIYDIGSTEPMTLSYLSDVKQRVVRNKYYISQSLPFPPSFYNSLPNVFVVTDADIYLSNSLKSSFLEDMNRLSNIYKSGSVSLALNIEEFSLMYPYNFSDFGYINRGNILELESPYWKNKIRDRKYSLYRYSLNNEIRLSSFTLFNKRRIWKSNCDILGEGILLAGEFTARSFSWYRDTASIYKENKISRLHRYLSHYLSLDYYPIKYFELQYLIDNSIDIARKDSTFHLVQKEGDYKDIFWFEIYPKDYNPLFSLFSLYLSKDKDYIDIGSWIGDTLLYPSRFSKRVIGVEPDPRLLVYLRYLARLNFLEEEIIIEESALFSATTSATSYLVYGDLSYPGDDTRINPQYPQSGDIQVTTLTFPSLIKKYNVEKVSLINVNINGGEESIFQDLYDFCKKGNVPLYIKFYYSLWVDRDLTRFPFLTEDQIKGIVNSERVLFFP